MIEAASFGVVVTLGFFLMRHQKDFWPPFIASCLEAAGAAGMIFLMVIGANVFSYFLPISGATLVIVDLITGTGLSD